MKDVITLTAGSFGYSFIVSLWGFNDKWLEFIAVMACCFVLGVAYGHASGSTE